MNFWFRARNPALSAEERERSERTGAERAGGPASRGLMWWATKGALKRIVYPNQSVATIHWLGPTELGPGVGTEDWSGRMAQSKVEAALGGTLLGLHRLGYDVFGNVTQEQSLMEGTPESGRWVVTEREFNL